MEETKFFSVVKQETQILEEKLPMEEEAGLVEVPKAFIKENDHDKGREIHKNKESVEYL